MNIYITFFNPDPGKIAGEVWTNKQMALNYAKDQIETENADKVFSDEELEEAALGAIETHEIKEY